MIALPKIVLASATIRRYQLTANKSNVSFDGKGNETSLWLYNKTTPGPLLKARRGEIIEVDFINGLDHPTAIHWHGIRNINEMDGVPDLTQVAVEPGETFTYRFPVNDAGTFWYHAHHKSWEQNDKIASAINANIITKMARAFKTVVTRPANRFSLNE